MANDLGLTHTDLEAEYHELVFSASTSPTDTHADALLDRYAGEEINIVQGWGRSTPTTDSPLYLQLRSLVIYRALAQLIAAMERRRTDLVDYYTERADGVRERLRTYPQDAHTDRPTTSDSPGIHASHVSTQAREDALADAYEDRGQPARLWRMLARGAR